MFCQKCGKELPVGSVACNFCGASTIAVTPSRNVNNPSDTAKLKDKYENAKAEYDKANTMGWPVLLVFFGIILFFLNFVLGLIVSFAGIIWAGMRIASRGHLYQKMKDAERELE
jgi:uncharacterized membrane protein YvbJ